MQRVLHNQSTLLVQATGSGKSLCYQVGGHGRRLRDKPVLAYLRDGVVVGDLCICLLRGFLSSCRPSF
jgi:superfamily II DNA helicase RecQ